MKNIKNLFIVGALCAFFLVLGILGMKSRDNLKFVDCLDEAAFWANGEEIKIKELAFYVLYEEGEIEKQAMLYDAENTKKYWNLHINGVFIQQSAKDNIMNMAIHDALYYQQAVADGVTLTAEEEQYFRNEVSDFWMDLLDVQKENLPVSDEFIWEKMRQIAVAEKYQKQLAKKEKKSEASYQWDGSEYEKWLAKQTVKVNNKVWERIVVGDITLRHDSPFANKFSK